VLCSRPASSSSNNKHWTGSQAGNWRVDLRANKRVLSNRALTDHRSQLTARTDATTKHQSPPLAVLLICGHRHFASQLGRRPHNVFRPHCGPKNVALHHGGANGSLSRPVLLRADTRKPKRPQQSSGAATDAWGQHRHSAVHHRWLGVANVLWVIDCSNLHGLV